MKNKEYQKILAYALTASMVIGGSGVLSMPVGPEEKPVQIMSTQVAQAAASESEKGDGEKAEALKDETVYVKLDASGKVSSVTVSDQLKNIGGLKVLRMFRD
ncbi:MAG: hypothetical protein V8R85_10985 [Frisingicoccus sp.]